LAPPSLPPPLLPSLAYPFHTTARGIDCVTVPNVRMWNPETMAVVHGKGGVGVCPVDCHKPAGKRPRSG
jgi:hypothetical protein